jgi:hypothetical protein
MTGTVASSDTLVMPVDVHWNERWVADPSESSMSISMPTKWRAVATAAPLQWATGQSASNGNELAMAGPRNSFNALCELASAERWCWRIHCTTCGHMLFRYGLHVLLLDRHPDSSSWKVSDRNPVLCRGGQPRELGQIPPRWEPWPIAEQYNLLEVLAKADIHDIRQNCTYPDWLGYLGLGLKYTEDAERATRAITNMWIPQLIDERDDSRAKQLLASILSSQAVLTWQHLEKLE